jgi:hypothetical protein
MKRTLSPFPTEIPYENKKMDGNESRKKSSFSRRNGISIRIHRFLQIIKVDIILESMNTDRQRPFFI